MKLSMPYWMVEKLVDRNFTVHANNEGYIVHKDNLGQYLITFTSNDYNIGLRGKEGTDAEYVMNATQFIIKEYPDFPVDELLLALDAFTGALSFADGSEEEDKFYDFEIDHNYREVIGGMIIDFYLDNKELCDKYIESIGWSGFGTDLYFDIMGHGAGFWDRGLGEIGEKLSTLCEDIKYNVIARADMGDDKTIHFYNH